MVKFKDAALGALGFKATTRASARRSRPASAKVPAGLNNQQSIFGNKTWDLSKALKDGYEINEWVHACVNAVAQHCASVPWRVSEFSGAEQKNLFHHELKGIPHSQRADFFKDAHYKRVRGKWGAEKKALLQPKPDDPLEQLLEDPNSAMTREEMMERVVQHMLLGGNGLWVKLRAKVLGVPGYKTPFEIWPLFPQAVEVEREGMAAKKYHYAPQGKHVNPKTEADYVPEDVVHFRIPDPKDAVWGIAPLTAAARAVDTDVEQGKWNYNSTKNRAVPDILFSFKDKLDPKDYKEARKRVREQQRERGSWVLGNAADVHQMSLSPVEMDFIKSRGLNRQSICTVFRVFPGVIMVMEGATLANMETILKHHWIQTVIPFMNNRLMSVINKHLTPEFDAAGDRLAWFDTSNVDALTENLLERSRIAKTFHTAGVPMAVCNDRLDLGFNLDDVPLANEPIFPAGVVTASQIIAGENSSGAGDGNTDTAPEGGDTVDPGDGQEPNESPAEEPVADDPGNNPDTVLSALYLTNGNSDPHKGTKRWSLEEAWAWIEEHSLPLAPGYPIKGDDAYEFAVDITEGLPLKITEEIGSQVGFDERGIEWEGGQGQDYIRFYHGQAVQEKRDRLIQRVRSWGYAV